MSLQLDFDSSRAEPPSSRPSGLQTDAILDRAFEERSSPSDGMSLAPIPIARRATAGIGAPFGPTVSPSGGSRASGGTPNVDSAQPEWASMPFSSGREAAYREATAAPLKTRFWSGLIDAAVLLVAAGLFAGIFVLAGGRLQSQPVELGMFLFIAAFWIFVYFAAFTLLVFNTPGQAAVKLAVRNLDGDPPTPQEALLRGFGYVISVGTLMLGFLWAAMDSDGMAWHDHISGTVLVEQE